MKFIDEVNKSFFDFSIQKNSLQDFYGNYLKYDSSYQIPRVITLTTDVDYRKKIILTDSLLLIGLDNYLRRKPYFLFLISKISYKQHLIKRILVIDIAKEYAVDKQLLKKEAENYTFIEKIINQGKILYFASAMLPEKEEPSIDNRLHKSLDFQWALENEKDIWSNFI